MAQAGSALMAIGRGSGENRAVDAAKAAIASPLLDVTVDGARGVLFNVTGGPDMTLWEVNEAAQVIYKAADPEANIIFGAVIDPDMEGEIKITLLAAGFTSKPASAAASFRAALAKDQPAQPTLPGNGKQPIDIGSKRETKPAGVCHRGHGDTGLPAQVSHAAPTSIVARREGQMPLPPPDLAYACELSATPPDAPAVEPRAVRLRAPGSRGAR